MITPIELQGKTFKTGIGYDKKEVESFLNSLLHDYESLYKENMELNDKINVLNEGINYYKEIEKTLQKALVLAEKTAEDTKEAAIKQARAIEKEARTKAQLIVADANNELQRLQQQIIQLAMQYDSYKAQFKHLAAAQCEFLESETFRITIPDFKVSAAKENKDPYPDNTYEMNDPELKTAPPEAAFQEAASWESTSRETPEDEADGFEYFNLNEDE